MLLKFQAKLAILHDTRLDARLQETKSHLYC